jgi:hypothetical protein
MSTLLFRDAFTGAVGPLYAHTPDTYSSVGVSVPGWQDNVVGLALTGSGTIKPDFFAAASEDFIEMEGGGLVDAYRFVASGNFSAEHAFISGLIDLYSTTAGIPYAWIGIDPVDGTNFSITAAVSDDTTAQTNFTPVTHAYGAFQIDVLVVGTTIKLFVDSVLKETLTLTASPYVGIGENRSIAVIVNGDFGVSELTFSEVSFSAESSGNAIGAAGGTSAVLGAAPTYEVRDGAGESYGLAATHAHPPSDYLREDFTTGGASANALTMRQPTRSEDAAVWGTDVGTGFDLSHGHLRSTFVPASGEGVIPPFPALSDTSNRITFVRPPVGAFEFEFTVENVGYSLVGCMFFEISYSDVGAPDVGHTHGLIVQIFPHFYSFDQPGLEIGFAAGFSLEYQAYQRIHLPSLSSGDIVRIIVESTYQLVYVNGVFVERMNLKIPLANLLMQDLFISLTERPSSLDSTGRLRAFKLTQVDRPSEFWTDFNSSYEIP